MHSLGLIGQGGWIMWSGEWVGQSSCAHSVARSAARSSRAGADGLCACVLRVLTLVSCLTMLASPSGCISASMLEEVARDNASASTALADNARLASELIVSEARQSGERWRNQARERVAGELVEVLLESGSFEDAVEGSPEASALANVGSLGERARQLRDRLALAGPVRRESAVIELANDHPALIEIASDTPGFDLARVLRDAQELDRLNRVMERESAGAVREGVRDRRDALLDAYTLARRASADADAYLGLAQELAHRLVEQSQVARIDSESLVRASSADRLRRADARGTLDDPAIRSLLSSLVLKPGGSGLVRRLIPTSPGEDRASE